MNATPVPLPGGGFGYLKGSVANFGDGLYYAIADVAGDPSQYPDVWALMATRSGGSSVYTDNGIQPSSVMAASNSTYWTLVNATDYLENNAQIAVDQGGFDITTQRGDHATTYQLGPYNGSFVMWPQHAEHPGGYAALEWYAADDNLHPTVRLVGIPDKDPFHSSVLEAGVDSNGTPYLRLLDQTLHMGWGSGLGGAAGLPSGTTDGQVLTWNGTTWAPADLPADDDSGSGSGGGSTFSLTGVYRGDWSPAATLEAAYAPAGTIDFEGGDVPPFLRSQNLYGGYTSSDWGDGAAGSQAALLFVSSAGDLGFLELDLFDVDSVRLTLAWGLNTDGTGRILLDGTEIESVTGADGQNGHYLWHSVPAGPGQHTLRVEVTGGPSGGQNVVAIDQIDTLGTTPAGYTAGWNPGGSSSTSYEAGDLVRYGGDLWLTRTATDNSAPPADGGIWARLSTHGGSGGASGLPDPGTDGNLLTAQASAWVSAPPPGDDAPDLTLIFENGLV